MAKRKSFSRYGYPADPNNKSVAKFDRHNARVAARGAMKATRGLKNKRIAKTTGTTVGEARGDKAVLRKDLAAGRYKKVRREVRSIVQGGPRAGVARTPKRVASGKRVAKTLIRDYKTLSGAGRPGGISTPSQRARSEARPSNLPVARGGVPKTKKAAPKRASTSGRGKRLS
jgi:hypothetical protein